MASSVHCCQDSCPWTNSGKVPELVWHCSKDLKRPCFRFFPCVWTPCGDCLQVWCLLSTPDMDVAQQLPLLKFLGTAVHLKRTAYVLMIWSWFGHMGGQSFWHLLLHLKGRNKSTEDSTEGDWNLFYWAHTTSSQTTIYRLLNWLKGVVWVKSTTVTVPRATRISHFLKSNMTDQRAEDKSAQDASDPIHPTIQYH